MLIGRGPKLNIGVYGARGIPSTYSGYETFLTVLLPELARRGHEVTIYCRGGHIADDAPYLGVRRVILAAPQSKEFETLVHGFRAATAARAARHDVVFAVNVANAFFCLLARKTGQRVVLNTDGQEWLRGKWGRFGRRFFLISAGLARFGASSLIADSCAMRDIYLDRFNSDSTVIPYCWSSLESAQGCAPLERFDLSPRRYFLVGGRLNPENNIDAVVRAYVDSGAELPIVVLGEANYDSPVQRNLSELACKAPNVVLAGHVEDRAHFATLVRESLTYVHAHSIGGINPSIIEAMGCGAQILALDTKFNREALGDAGTYFSDFNVELPRMFRTITSDGTEEELREKAFARVVSNFGLQAVADAHEELFQVVAARHPWRRTTIPTSWSP